MAGGSLNVSNCSNLYTLVCTGNQLTNLDIRGCSVLHDLYCQDNQLTNLDFSNCSKIVWVNCDNNRLNNFDISGCTILSGFSCNNNQLTSLNVSGYKALKSIDCSSNQLISLNSSGCSDLEALNCDNNELINLDVSGCSALKTLNCIDQQLTNLDITGCSSLTSLICHNNQLTNLDVSTCSNLQELHCSYNRLSNLNTSNCIYLERLYIIGLFNESNRLTSLNVSGCTSLSSLACSNQQLASLDASGCSNLTSLSCDNNQLTRLDVSGCLALTSLSCYENQLTGLNLSSCPSLQELNCYTNQLTNLNVSSCLSLSTIYCYDNRLTDLDISEHPYLVDLSCSNNQLTSLNVSGCSDLQELNCGNNQLTGLDVSEHLYLNRLECDYNQLASLYVGGCTSLSTLNCWYNQLTSLDVSGCTDLDWLYCDNNRLTYLNASGCADLYLLSCSNNQLTSLDLSGCFHLNYLACSYNQLSDSNLNAFYGLNIGCDNSRLDLRHNICFTEQAIRNLANNLPCLSYEQIYWDECSNNSPFSFENNWTVSKTPEMPEHPVGVGADGCSSIKISLTQNDESINVQNVDIYLTEINGNNNPGTIGTSVSDAAEIRLIGLSYLPDNIFYIAPDVFTEDTINTDWNRKVVIQIIINNTNRDKGYALYDTIEIIRPPVLLVHGLNSDSKCFADLREDLWSRSHRYISEQVLCVNYKGTNTSSFEENAYVLPTNIKKVKDYIQKKGYTVSKVDVVGHSMGGILSRLYLQSSYYDNNIHKLITVNTPHSGSQGANVLVQLPSLRQKHGLTGKAVDDLQVTSDAIRTQLNGISVKNRNRVPSHAIVTETNVYSEAFKILKKTFSKDPLYCTIVSAFLLTNPLGEAVSGEAIGLSLAFNNWLFNDIYNDDNDIVVAVNSQIGGLGSTTLVHDEWHCGSPINVTVKSRIKELLVLPASVDYFSMQGFNPPTIDFPTTKNTLIESKSLVNYNDSVYFKLPTSDIMINSGDSITIEVSRTANVKNLIFTAMESQDSVYLKDTTASSMSFTYHVPSTTIGKIPMYVFGADTLGNIYMDSLSATVSPNATAQSLFITYPEDSLLELSQGLKSFVQVSCLFSDSVTRDITTLANVQYSTQTGNAVVEAQGVIKGAHEGFDTLIVSYSGLSYNLPISINQDYTCAVNVSVNPDNSGTTTGTGVYFYGDSVTLAAAPESGYAFDYWSENGVEVSTNVSYSIETYTSKDIVANFRVTTGIETIPIDNNGLISIYPNPNHGDFTVKINSDYAGDVEINIFSVTGVQCDHIEFVKSVHETKQKINSKYLGKGIYFVEILLGEDTVTKKIIIE